MLALTSMSKGSKKSHHVSETCQLLNNFTQMVCSWNICVNTNVTDKSVEMKPMYKLFYWCSGHLSYWKILHVCWTRSVILGK